jgi:hypothetical protein
MRGSKSGRFQSFKNNQNSNHNQNPGPEKGRQESDNYSKG